MVGKILTVCDSCIDAGYDELPLGDAGRTTTRRMSVIMRDMGDMVGDHLCDQIESDGDIRCNCGCR